MMNHQIRGHPIFNKKESEINRIAKCPEDFPSQTWHVMVFPQVKMHPKMPPQIAGFQLDDLFMVQNPPKSGGSWGGATP